MWQGHGKIVVDIQKQQAYLAIEKRRRPDAVEVDRAIDVNSMKPADVILSSVGKVKTLYAAKSQWM